MADAPEICNCLALRQATRRLSQIYDGFLAPSGLRGTQFTILAKVAQHGPVSVNELARILVMDRTTVGRNLRPLERDGLIGLAVGRDRRSRDIVITETGKDALRRARPLWQAAQASFETGYGHDRARTLRGMLHEVAALDEPTRDAIADRP